MAKHAQGRTKNREGATSLRRGPFPILCLSECVFRHAAFKCKHPKDGRKIPKGPPLKEVAPSVIVVRLGACLAMPPGIERTIFKK